LFKYDRDYLCVNKPVTVPVIFEPPCTHTIIVKIDLLTLQCQIAYGARFRRRWRFVLWTWKLKYVTVQSGIRVPKIWKNILTSKCANSLTMGAASPAEVYSRPCHRFHEPKFYFVHTHSDYNLTRFIILPKGLLDTSVIYSINICFRRLYSCHLQGICV